MTTWLRNVNAFKKIGKTAILLKEQNKNHQIRQAGIENPNLLKILDIFKTNIQTLFIFWGFVIPWPLSLPKTTSG
jgi:hypothetical protein